MRHNITYHQLIGLSLALCLLSIPLACAFGPLRLPLADVEALARSLFSGASQSVTVITPEGLPTVLDSQTLRLVVLDLRLPRVLLALCSGAGLAVAGAVFQGILRNPLADPFTLGVSGGAAFGAALAISLGLAGAVAGFGIPLAAFAGAIVALAAVLALGRVSGGLDRNTLILAGVVVSALLAALIALIKALDEASVTGIVFWIMGSFQGRGWGELLLLLPGLCGGCLLAFALTGPLDLLSLGDSTARHLGLNARRVRLLLLLAAGAVTASCVAVSGIIGFVGLIVPHLCRLILGAGHKRLLPASALCGALLLLWSDVAARTLLPGGVELPVGVVTALLGGPFFCFLLGRGHGSPPRILPKRVAPARNDPRPAPPQTAQLCCSGLEAGYGGHCQDPVLRDINICLAPGEFVGLLGSNACGKTTLLRCLSGLLPPRQGRVVLSGRDVGALTDRERARLLAHLPQKPENVPALSVFHMALLGRYAHTPFTGGYRPVDRQKAHDALELAGVAHLDGRMANALSGGELQRVLLARALAQECPLLFLDEATAGLDPAFQTLVLDVLARRNTQQGLTILAAMHDLNLSALYCRRLIVMRQGRILADGPTEQVFTPDVLEAAYDCQFAFTRHPATGMPQVLPRALP
jgi:iron complex transport system permease protein